MSRFCGLTGWTTKYWLMAVRAGSGACAIIAPALCPRHGTMSSLLEFLLLAAFFLSYLWKGIFFATAVIMAGSVLVLAASWWRTRKFETLPLMVAVLSCVFGVATLLLHDPIYLKWKFSVV